MLLKSKYLNPATPPLAESRMPYAWCIRAPHSSHGCGRELPNTMAIYPTMDGVGENIAESFKMFKQRMSLILLDENIVYPAKQAIKIQISVGTEGLQRLNASTLTDEDNKDPAKIYKLFDDQLDIKVNFRIHRMELMTFRQNEHETTDEFVNRARHKGSLCDFGEPELVERIIELIIASRPTPNELLQKQLLDQDKGYSLGHVLTEARKYEGIAAGKQSLQSLKIPHHIVNEVKRRNIANTGRNAAGKRNLTAGRNQMVDDKK